MALYDIDKTSDTRLTPALNADDNVMDRLAHNTTQTTYRTAGSDTTPRMAFKNGLILTYDADDNCSSVYGYIPELSSTPVFIIAKEGYDIFEDILGIDPPVV